MVVDLRKEFGISVKAAVRDGGKGVGQLQVGYAHRKSAQGHRAAHILIRQRGDAQIPGEVHALLRRHGFHEAPHRHDIHGEFDALPDGGITEVFSLPPPVPEFLFSELIFRIVVGGGQGRAVFLDGRCKGGYHLEGGAGLALHIRGPVEGQVVRFLASAAGDRLYLLGLLVHDHHGYLRLQHRIQGLCDDLVSLRQYRGFELVDGVLQRLRGTEQAVIALVLHIDAVIFDIVLAVMGLGSVRMEDGAPPGKAVFCRIIVVRVVDLLVHDLLDRRILSGLDPQAAGIQQIRRLFFRKSQPLPEDADALLDEGVRKPGVGMIFRSINGIHDLDPVIDVVRKSRLMLFRIDVALVLHVLQHLGPTLRIFLRMGQGIEPGGVFGNGSQHRALGKVQLADLLSEIAAGGHLDAQGIVAQIDGVEIIRDDLFFHLGLVHSRLVFQHQGQIPLLEFSFIKGKAAFHASMEHVVLDQLLGDGRTAAGILSRQHAPHRTGNGPQVDAVVLPETLVLDGHKGVYQIVRQLLKGCLLTVGALLYQGCHQVSLCVIGL